MALDRELAQFIDVYNDRSDQELLGLYENRDDLTELAQQALSQVMKERELSVTGVPVQPVPENHAQAASSALDADEAEIQTFDDAFRLNEALRLLTHAEIPHRVLNWDEVDPKPSRGYLRLGLIVRKDDLAKARTLLQTKMKLFPEAEGNDFAVEDSFALLDLYPRADALRIAQALGTAGISYIYTDGRQDSSLDEAEVRIEVYASSLEEAAVIVQNAL